MNGSDSPVLRIEELKPESGGVEVEGNLLYDTGHP